MWNIIVWLIFGAIAGWIASKINNTDDQQGWIGNIVMGIVGALVGGFLYTRILDEDLDAISWVGLLVAIVGALIFSWAMGKLTGKKAI